MASDTVVRARIDGQVKEKAAKVLADMGLSVSDAIRLLLVRIAVEKALPFEIKVPNEETRAAMAELEQGAGASFDSVADLMADLECGGLSAPVRSNAITAGPRRSPATVIWTSAWSPSWNFWSMTTHYRLGTATMLCPETGRAIGLPSLARPPVDLCQTLARRAAARQLGPHSDLFD